ncbi:ribonuclease P protein component [Thiospirochaeta perfilievii]|uniref:Ribonuclease P protein component n=1 Tax=Thiospirochaeta perfilievii TaxID=252967 RepID=A0A5C1QB98_9SPIO|nr:ribonuclease P protein component [Thiospirochaeta perfilievii]QEN04777.1 ribonuclease P protein component [Thiospirochaeta perfilievii]
MRKTLTRNERLSKQSDLKTVFATGSRSNTAGAKVVYLKNNLSYSRFAITIVRKFGNSVERNHAKRIFRELYRLNKDKILTGMDIIIILYPGLYNQKKENLNFIIC